MFWLIFNDELYKLTNSRAFKLQALNLYSNIKSVVFFSSLLKVQRLIVAACDTLDYYMSNKFVFQSHTYSAVCDRLNQIDREKYYNRATVNLFDQYL